jgi:hypothetical protein
VITNGLSYTVQESLQYQVPCIVTDVGGNTELIQDGVNGYVVPLDMNFDINKIKKIPECAEYENYALEKWLEYLEYDGPIIDKEEIIKKYKEEKEMKVKVRATKKFEGTRDAERNVIPKEGDVWETDEKRAELLAEKGYVVFEQIKEIEQEENPIKEKTKRTTRKTIAKKRKM